MKKIISVVGARPNFIKVAPIAREFKKHKEVKHLICHTGQHHDVNMSDIFFNVLEIPEPDFHLNISGGSHATQTAEIMLKFEEVILKEKPDLIIVYGDINSTLAATIVAAKLNIPIAHVEAGLRSFDRSMPEEINRILTDTVADYLFVTEKSGLVNLKNEGIDDSKVFFVGNVMIDSLSRSLGKIDAPILKVLDLKTKDFVLTTFHRPSNVDDVKQLSKIIKLLNKIALNNKVIFPIHPRTNNNLKRYNLFEKLNKNIKLIDPLGYLDFLSLIRNAKLIVTDSGGIQEESTYLGIQCITVRNSTERPVTIEIGTNQLAGENIEDAIKLTQNVLAGNVKLGRIPELWDGRAAERIVKIILNNL